MAKRTKTIKKDEDVCLIPLCNESEDLLFIITHERRLACCYHHYELYCDKKNPTLRERLLKEADLNG